MTEAPKLDESVRERLEAWAADTGEWPTVRMSDLRAVLAHEARQAATIEALSAQVEARDEALRPFAEYARAADLDGWEGEMGEVYKDGLRISIRNSDLRRAASLSGETGGRE